MIDIIKARELVDTITGQEKVLANMKAQLDIANKEIFVLRRKLSAATPKTLEEKLQAVRDLNLSNENLESLLDYTTPEETEETEHERTEVVG